MATSIAALPMLAAIVGEQGLARTTAGAIATAAMGVMDTLAWLALAARLIGADLLLMALVGHADNRSAY
jgi:Kef-type K+ transport system membrane component KefB